MPPDPERVYLSCKNLSNKIPMGSFGAGTGAVVGKLLTVKYGTKGGQYYSEEVVCGVRVGCFAVVNAFGDIKRNGRIIAGARKPAGEGFINTISLMKSGKTRIIPDVLETVPQFVLF